jgi:hypothetical protein
MGFDVSHLPIITTISSGTLTLNVKLGLLLGGVNIGNCHPAVLLHSKSY